MVERIRFSGKLWAASFALWTAYSLLYSGSMYLWYRSAGHPVRYWGNWMFIPLLNHWINASLTPLVLVFALRHPIRWSEWFRGVGARLIGMLLFTATHMAIRLALYPVRDQFTDQVVQASLRLFRSMFLYGLREDGLGAYLLIIVVAQAMYLQHCAREREIQSEQLRARLAEERLEALKLQLKPHFLFNTLNAISELVHDDPHGAEQVVVRLSDLLRFTLKNFDRNLIDFSEEIEILRTYLSIEKMRFAGRLSSQFEIDEDTLCAQVPCMMLQPIVENAIRHGIGHRNGFGKIIVKARAKGPILEINVRDDGTGLTSKFSEEKAQGIGLRNTRERLQHLFAADAQLTIANDPAGGVVVNIRMPIIYRCEKTGAIEHEHIESGDNRRRTPSIAAVAPAGERTI